MGDYRQSDAYCEYFSKKGLVTDSIGATRALSKHVPLIGTVIRIQRGSANTPIADIDAFAKKHSAAMLFIETDGVSESALYAKDVAEFTRLGFTDINFFLSPTKTTRINLLESESAILAGFDRDIRKHLKLNSEKGITFKTTDCMEEFYNLVTEASHRGKYFVQPFSGWKNKWSPFGNQVRFILAYLDGKLLGGNMFTVQPPYAFGLSLPSTEFGRNHQISATLIWEGLLCAKSLGCSEFDLNGLYDERYKAPKKWLGLTAFKRKFRGHEVEFMHPKIKVYKWYLKPLEKLGLLWMFFVDA